VQVRARDWPGPIGWNLDRREAQRAVESILWIGEALSDQPVGESWFDLPAAVEEPFEVYVNGISQHAGDDYECVDRALVFPRPLVAEVRMSRIQWFLSAIGIGSYKKADSVDVIYQWEGRRLVATLAARAPIA
jgi:hypothetical protein